MAEQELSDADLDRAERAADQVLNDMVAELGAATLAGDVHNKIMAHIRTIDGFAALSEMRQDAIIRATDDLARHLVIAAIETVADKGFNHIVVEAGKFTVGEELKGTFVMANATEEAIVELARYQGRKVLVVFADAKDFLGTRGNAPKASPDQPDLLDQPAASATGMDEGEQQEIEDDTGHEAEEENEPPAIPAPEGGDPAAAAAAKAWSEEDGRPA